ncbi:hypothetical protein ABE444_09665 [Brevundimonas pondensis]
MSASTDRTPDKSSASRRRSPNGLPNWLFIVLVAAVVAILGLLVAGATGG